ncbi:hypothetical protein B0J13DRAFT_553508 [Dactylonectria estremocensis]|uniref:C2H2-type domain-containing protein n=1 Tax=Dactylonectria estremocensis TaxID=1079267 RepID=A0A9P9EUV5_9HYPO|nr:hypothetical protein B0J13DRAFT_553508 [Dactylonectria estremocensis]
MFPSLTRSIAETRGVLSEMNTQDDPNQAPASWPILDHSYSGDLQQDAFSDLHFWIPPETQQDEHSYQQPRAIDSWVASCSAPRQELPLNDDSLGAHDDVFSGFDDLTCQFLNTQNDTTEETTSFASVESSEPYTPSAMDGEWLRQASIPFPTTPHERGSPQNTRPISGSHPGLPRRKSKYFRSHRSMGRPVSIPMPPETEPASFSAIADALQKTYMQQEPGSRNARRTPASSGSITSWTSCSSNSVSSSRSSKSNTFLGPKPTPRNRVKKAHRDKPGAHDPRRFPCTFCCDAFKTKYDWARHEKSLHLDLDQWVCAPRGASVVDAATGRSHCAYCNVLDPTSDHLDGHNHYACHAGQQTRSFRRKDHLVQHLRVLHRLETLPVIENWRIEPPAIASRCGFCDETLSSWQARADHLADHFRKGMTMADWKGGNGFDPSVASQVRNAIPPYNLATEAKTLVPFSATDPRTTDHLSQILQEHALNDGPGDQRGHETFQPSQPVVELSPTTYASFLALHLGRFAQRKISEGICPTDQMFQDEARRLVYGSADGWEHTIVDNTEWISTFRRQLSIPERDGIPR